MRHVVLSTALIILATLNNNPTQIIGDKYVAMQVRCTCYTDSGTMANGRQTRNGCIAGRKEWLGMSCALYESKNGEIGDFIGYYEFTDTGSGIDTDGDGKGDSIKLGKSVDVWVSSYEEVTDWQSEHGDYVYMVLIDSEG